MNSDIDKLNTIEGADFPSIEHNLDDNTLKIEVVTKFPFREIDSKIIKALAGHCNLTLLDAEMENKLHLSLQRGLLAPIRLEDRFWITYNIEPKTDHQIISGQLMKSWGAEIFVESVETDVDKLFVCFKTNLSLGRVDFLFREALEDFYLIKEQSSLVARGDGYGDGAFEYEFNKVPKGELFIPAKYASEEIATENMVLSDIVKIDKVTITSHGCPDCKDGFYYPLTGPPEPCRTCK